MPNGKFGLYTHNHDGHLAESPFVLTSTSCCRRCTTRRTPNGQSNSTLTYQNYVNFDFSRPRDTRMGRHIIPMRNRLLTQLLYFEIPPYSFLVSSVSLNTGGDSHLGHFGWNRSSPDTMNELIEKLDLMGISLDVVQKDALSTNNKVEALSKAKEGGVGRHSGHIRSSHSSEEEMRERHERHRREERHEIFGVQGRKGVSLVVVALEDYALVWWTSLMDDIKRGIEEPCESWYDFKRMMRKQFMPASYERDIHHKLQSLYQGWKSVEEYHKEMELTLLRAQIRVKGSYHSSILAWVKEGDTRYSGTVEL
ncbi:hypothetical protein CR513_37123, partial [Mucuna pruriens]